MKSLKQSPFQELESLLATWLKEARGSNAEISVTLLREKAVYTATRLGIEYFKAANDTVLCTKLFNCGGMEKGTVTQNY
jgi:hypothetical protein